jgi:hypothetical protein
MSQPSRIFERIDPRSQRVWQTAQIQENSLFGNRADYQRLQAIYDQEDDVAEKIDPLTGNPVSHLARSSESTGPGGSGQASVNYPNGSNVWARTEPGVPVPHLEEVFISPPESFPDEVVVSISERFPDLAQAQVLANRLASDILQSQQAAEQPQGRALGRSILEELNPVESFRLRLRALEQAQTEARRAAEEVNYQQALFGQGALQVTWRDDEAP